MLPLNTKFVPYALDTNSRCYFCKWGPENEWHLFGKCQKLKALWQALDDVIRVAFNIRYSFLKNRTESGDIDLVSTRCPKQYEDAIIYLNAITNHKIFKVRNEAKYDGKEFDLEILYKKIVRSVASRKSIENRLIQITQILGINELYRALVFVKDLHFLQSR